ncbi:MAG TPA: hypothetical protein DGR97_01530 [Gammaproteobacteria bacterium]|nr:hypothetical protein [Gammaproteobacteria bacterium]
MLVILVVFNGCASNTVSRSPSSAKTTFVSALYGGIRHEGKPIPLNGPKRLDFDSEGSPLYHLIVAEFAGQRGQADLAVTHYLKTAKQLRDLDIAKRATRIAVFAQKNEAALEAATIWVEQAPEDLEARQILAAMHIRSGNADEASVHLEHVLNAKSERAHRRLRMIANLLSREEDKLTALSVMEQLLLRRPSDRDALVAYALLAIRADELDKASEAMDRVTDTGVGDANIAMAYVALLQKHQKSRAAIEWLERSIAKSPNDTALRIIYARLLADASRYEEAHVQFAIVAAKNPENSDVLYALGLLNLQLNRIDAAHKNFKQLLKFSDRSDDANFYLGQIADSREQFGDAIEFYRAIKLGQNYFQAQIRIALILSSQNNVIDAQAHLHSIFPKDEKQRFELLRAEGEILIEHNRLEEAWALYDGALVDVYDMGLLYARAMLAEKMGRLEILEADLKTIIEREPDNSQALNALGYTLADRTNRYEEAYKYIKQALTLNPDDFYILDSMGWALYRLGRFREAIDFLNRALKIKDDPEVAAHLGEVLWVMGDKDAARDIWGSALREKPGDQHLLDVIKRLAP